MKKHPSFSTQGYLILVENIDAHKCASTFKRFIVVCLLWLAAFLSGWAETLDYTVLPKANENFLEASFRFVIPTQEGPVTNVVLVYIPGTDGDGRGIVSDPHFLALGNACHAAVVGCYFRGEGLSYDDPTGGSGRALDEALGHFAAQTNLSQLSQPNLLLVGFSQGGMFVYNYVCCYPERVKAFAALRAVFPRFKPLVSSFLVPGLLAAGELDQPGRVRSIASTFKQAEDHNSKWTFLLERNSGHDLGKSVELVDSLFEAVSLDKSLSCPVFLDTMGKEVTNPSCDQDNLCWFPNQETADLWKSIHRPAALKDLATLSVPQQLQNPISIRESPELLRCSNGGKTFASVHLSALDPKMVIKRIKVDGDCFSLAESPTGTPPTDFKVCFAPKEMLWGETRGLIVVTGELDGRAEDVTATLCGMVVGPLTPIPSTVYLGFVARGQTTEKSILLHPNESCIHFADIRVPEGVRVECTCTNHANLTLLIHWTGGNRLGRMQGQIDLTIDAPETGTLHIPIFGFIAPASSRARNQNSLMPPLKTCLNRTKTRLIQSTGRMGLNLDGTQLGKGSRHDT